MAIIINGIPYGLYKLGKTALDKNWVKDKHNSEFNRRTGMVTFSWRKKRVSYPFVEFDAAMQSVVDRTGLTSYYLIVMHRYSGQFWRHPSGNYEQWQVEMDWEELQHYMDVSKPLPDVPSYDHVRHLDPVTKEWDGQHHRPKDYWKNLSEKDADTLQERSKQYAAHYPFGKTREEAMILGWQSSNVGEGDWRQS